MIQPSQNGRNQTTLIHSADVWYTVEFQNQSFSILLWIFPRSIHANPWSFFLRLSWKHLYSPSRLLSSVFVILNAAISDLRWSILTMIFFSTRLSFEFMKMSTRIKSDIVCKISSKSRESNFGDKNRSTQRTDLKNPFQPSQMKISQMTVRRYESRVYWKTLLKIVINQLVA